jgi:cell division protein FtsL
VEKVNLIFGIVVSGIAICTAVVGFAAWFVKIQISGLSAQVAGLQRELHEYKEQVKELDDRQRRHTGDTDKHINAAWRQDLSERLSRIENSLHALLERK